jgi:hypothetical protein
MTRASSRCRTAARSGALRATISETQMARIKKTVTMLTAGKKPKQLNPLLTDND